jgi:glucosamine--fructose-6-phosphate aminotransferase (isomerizing)
MPTRASSLSEGLHVIRMPEHYGELSALLHVVPLQLLAYHGLRRGTDVTSPESGKVVTVE